MNIGTCCTKQALRVLTDLFFVLFIILTLNPLKDASASGVSFYGTNIFDGIPSGMIRDIEVVDDTIFIAAENGVFKVIGGYSKKLTFNQESNDTGVISDIFYDSHGYLWIAEYGVGVFKYNLLSGDSKKFTATTNNLEEVWNINITSSYAILTLIDGIYIIELDTRVIQSWSEVAGPKKLSNAYSLNSKNDNDVFIASKYYLVDINLGNKDVNLYKLDDHYPEITEITAIELTRDKIYLGGPEGIYSIDIESNTKIFYELPSTDSIKHQIRKIFVSDSGEIWVAAGGIYRIIDDEIKPLNWMNPILTSDAINSVLSINEIPDKGIVISSSQLGLIVLTDSQRAVNYLSYNDALYQKNIKSAGVTLDGFSYINDSESTYILLDELGKLGLYNSKSSSSCSSGRKILFENSYRKRYGDIDFCNNEFNHLTLPNEGFYFAYLKLDTEWKYFLVKDSEIIDEFDAPPYVEDSVLLSSGELISYDAYNNVHIQLSKYTWKTLKSVDTHWVGIDCIIEFNNSYLVCTSGSGLKQINSIDGSISNSDILDEYNVRFVRAALLSKNNNLWISTNIGVFIYDVSKLELYKLDRSHGIFDVDFEYGGIYGIDEKIIIVGDRYVYSVDELRLMKSLNDESMNLSRVSIVSIEWNSVNNNVKLMPNGSLKHSLLLDHDYEEIKIFLASNNYVDSESDKLEFRILGYMDEWKIHGSSHATLSLSDINYGEYELQTRGHDPTLSSLFPITSLNFEIKPPFYLQWYSICTYILTLILSLILFRIGYFDSTIHFIRNTRIYNVVSELCNKKTKEEVLNINKIKIFSDISHELKTPLNIIISSLNNVSKHDNLDVNFSLLMHNARKMESLVSQGDVFDEFGIEPNSNFKMYSMDNISNIVLGFESLAIFKGRNLKIDVKGNGCVSLYKDSVESIISNLILNSIKFTEKHGNIEFSSVIDDRYFKIAVSDDGIGIDSAHHNDIFKRFKRINSIDGVEGEGIGLSLVKELVSVNQGKIVIDSELGVGSTFTITFPVDDIDEINISSTATYINKEWNDKAQILVVDNIREYRNYLFELLLPQYQCLVAKNGTQALDILRTHPVRLVIVDLFMRDMGGLELINLIRRNQRLKNIPIIVLTAKVDHDSKLAALKANVNCFLIKPVSDEELLLRVEHLLATNSDNENSTQANSVINTANSITDLPEVTKERLMEFYLRVIAVLEKNYEKRDFNREQAVIELNTTVRTLNRNLSDIGGYNFSQLLSRFRVEKAEVLLEKGCSVTESSMQVGFGSPSYFSTIFKRINGVSPKLYCSQKIKNNTE